jgi:hypothetical protein
MDVFPIWTSSAIIWKVIQRSVSTRECIRSMFSLLREVEGCPDLLLFVGSFRTSR